MVGAAQQVQQAFIVVGLGRLQSQITRLQVVFEQGRVKTLVQHAGVGQLVDHARVFHQVPRWPTRRAQQAQQLCMHRGTL